MAQKLLTTGLKAKERHREYYLRFIAFFNSGARMEPYRPADQRDANLAAYKQELRNQTGSENPLWAEKSTLTGVEITAQFKSRQAAVEYENKIKAIVGRQEQEWQQAIYSTGNKVTVALHRFPGSQQKWSSIQSNLAITRNSPAPSVQREQPGDLRGVAQKRESKQVASSEVASMRKIEVEDRQRLAKIRAEAKENIEKGISPEKASRELSFGMRAFLDDLYKRGIDVLRARGLGDPPCDYSFAVFGSLARMESGPFPDIDCMMVVAKKTDASVRYFQKLNQYVADCLYRLGEAPETGKTGLRFCEGKLSPAYQSYDFRYADPEHDSVKDAEMYKGSPELMAEPSPQDPTLRPVSEFVGEQKVRIEGFSMAATEISLVSGNDAVLKEYLELHRHARAATKSAEEGMREVIKMVPSPIMTQSIPPLMYAKGDFYRFPQVIVAHLAALHGIESANTFERIRALADKGVFDKGFADQLLKGMEQLLKFRILSQASYGEEFEVVATGNWQSFNKFRTDALEKIELLKKEPPNDFNNKQIRGLQAELQVWPKIAEHEFIKITPSRRDKVAVIPDGELAILAKKTIPALHHLYKMAEQSVSGQGLSMEAFKQPLPRR